MFRVLALALAISLATSVGRAAEPSIVRGPAAVVDGDTLLVGGVSIRLKGVDAAELGSAAGNQARDVMREIVRADEVIVCHVTGEKTWGREVGFCGRLDGLDINREVIARGAALACPRYSARYVDAETADARQRLTQAPYCRSHRRPPDSE